jgi:hypothetical protein
MLSKVPFLRKAELSALETAFADGFFLWLKPRLVRNSVAAMRT